MSTRKSITTKFRRSASPATSSQLPETYPPLLIVDDEPEIHETLKAMFEDAGYPIREANNGEEALRILRASPERFIILLDNYMPVLDGEGLLRAILRDRQLRRRHAIILVSAMPHLSRQLRLQRLLHSLSIDTISKPFNIIDLEREVERARAKLQH
ncbi:MAG: response regulator [Ktedonobacterales bacterium]